METVYFYCAVVGGGFLVIQTVLLLFGDGVWDGQNGKATSGFLQNLGRWLPPMLSMRKDVGGIGMPEFFGKNVGDEARTAGDGKAGEEETADGNGKPRSRPAPPGYGPRAPMTAFLPTSSWGPGEGEGPRRHR